MRLGREIAAALAGLGACGDRVSGPNPTDPPPLVEAVLVAGAKTTVFRVVTTARTTDGGPVRPIPASAVSLRLTEVHGPSAPLEPILDSAGYWRAGLPIAGGSRYRLEGTVAGVSTFGETTVPDSLRLLEPAADTVDLTLGRLQRFRVHWRARGASLLATAGGYFVIGAGGLGATSQTHDSATDFIVSPPDQAGETPIVWWALNADAERYLFDPDSPESNLRGPFGFLGGAATGRRVLRWR